MTSEFTSEGFVYPEASTLSSFSFQEAIEKVVTKFESLLLSTTIDNGIITFVVCDDLESFYNKNGFGEKNISWRTDASLDMKALINKIILISRNGKSACILKSSIDDMNKQFTLLDDNKLQDSHTITFQFHEKKQYIWYYPEGIDENGIQFDNTKAYLLDVNNLETVLDIFDTKILNGQLSLWKEPKNFTPKENVESTIQFSLFTFLIGRDTKLEVVPEYHNDCGRADLVLMSKHNPLSDRIILELKVAKSKNTPGSAVSESANKDAAIEVIRQARCYKDEINAKEAFACLYDMRNPKKIQNPDIVLEAAKEENKTAKIKWHYTQLINTPKAKRNKKFEELKKQSNSSPDTNQ